MDGKICVITGATSGIGRETARALGRMGATLALVGRDAKKGEETLADLRGAAKYPDRVSFFLADLASLQAVRRLAGELHEEYDHLDVLINNAGLINSKRHVTADGLEATMAVNHFAHFMLTGLVLDLLKAAAPSRIINLSSDAHHWARLELDDLQSERHYSGFAVYGGSKLANLLFTFELSRRLAGTRVTANAVHPGAVASSFALNNGGFPSLAMRMLRPFFISPEKGAQNSIYLANAPDVAEVTGRYFYKSKEHVSSKRSHDAELAQKLWDASETLTGYPYRSTLLPLSIIGALRQPAY
jgi:NAD(P)-dependent dehydrogenase (short-subunit alcohol dehydrogenase family)